nr:DUF3883 domain-containing protein [Labrenzia sp. OB1]
MAWALEGGKPEPFHISRNELEEAEAHRDDWYLFRLYELARAPKAFELRPPLEAHVALTATSFQASFGDKKTTSFGPDLPFINFGANICFLPPIHQFRYFIATAIRRERVSHLPANAL